MNFTREPIIETVITPREGCTLLIRNSKGNGPEDYLVESIEVVSFGHSFFFRSQERPKSFLVPVSDYEIIELKEARMALKNVTTDRAIKIGGGREAPPRPREEALQDAALSESRPAPTQEQRLPGKRDKRRRNRRGRDRHESQDYPRRDLPPEPRAESYEPPSEENQRSPEDLLLPPSERPAEEKAPSFISKLFPPPQTLIKDTMSRYKPVEGDIPPEPPKEPVEDDNEE